MKKIKENEVELNSFTLISYRNAVEYFDNKLILCNNAPEIDAEAWENCELCSMDKEFYQYFLTNCTPADAEHLRAWFGLDFIYSPALGLYILCVPHCGTSWDYVACDVFDKEVAKIIKRRGLEFKY